MTSKVSPQMSASPVQLSNECFRNLVDNARDVIFRYEYVPTRRFAYVNGACERLLGYTVQEYYADPDILLRAIHPDDAAMFTAVVRGEVAPPESFVLKFHHKDGHLVWTEQRCVPVFASDGSLLAVEGITRDVSDRIGAEGLLRESEERFRSSFEHAAIGMTLCSLDGRFIRVNRSMCKIVGYTEQEMVGLDWKAITHPEDLEADIAQAQRLIAGDIDEYHMLKRYFHRDGHIVWIMLTGSIVREPNGKPLYCMAQVQDVTAKKEAEDELRRREQEAAEAEARARTAELAHLSRVATMGQMASGLAHELNQPLAAIMNYAGVCLELAKANPTERPSAIAALEELMKEARRAGAIIARLRSSIRKEPPQRERLNVNELVRGAVNLLAFEMKRPPIPFQLCLDTGLAPVLADRVQIEQVLVNLIRNAIEAMREDSLQQNALLLETSRAQGGNAARICVVDNGPGVKIENLPRLFEQFFTTKPKGLGVGLSISRSIVESHGGVMTASPNSPRGMRFWFTLPIA